MKQEPKELYRATGVGAIVGAMFGVFGGPLGHVAGAATGSMLGATTGFVRSETSDEYLEDITKKMKPGDYGVIAEVSEQWTAPVDAKLQALGGVALREKRSDYVDQLIERRTEEHKAAVEQWKAERAAHKADRMEAKLDASLSEARERLQRVATKAHDRLDSTKRELEGKIAALEEQAKKAKPDVKQQVQQRIAAIRSEYSMREQKLAHAFEVAQEALRA